MNNDTLFGLVVGVALGIGGTLLVQKYLLKQYDEEWEELEEYYDDEDIETIDEEELESLINPPRSEFDDPIRKSNDRMREEINETQDVAKETLVGKPIYKDNKPPLEELVDYTKLYKTAEEDAPKEKTNVFDTAEVVPEEDKPKTKKEAREAATPPHMRNAPTYYDIVEISAEQFVKEAPDYDKAACTYYVNEGILAGVNDEVEVMDIDSSVGKPILLQFESDETLEVLYVSNITMATDYEIIAEYERTYDMDYKDWLEENGLSDEKG